MGTAGLTGHDFRRTAQEYLLPQYRCQLTMGYSLLAPGPLCLWFLALTGGVGSHLKGHFRYVRLDALAACLASV